MKIYEEKTLDQFEFWSGAIDTAKELTSDELNQIEFILNDLYPNHISATELNDWIASMLGYENWEALVREHEENNE